MSTWRSDVKDALNNYYVKKQLLEDQDRQGSEELQWQEDEGGPEIDDQGLEEQFRQEQEQLEQLRRQEMDRQLREQLRSEEEEKFRQEAERLEQLRRQQQERLQSEEEDRKCVEEFRQEGERLRQQLEKNRQMQRQQEENRNSEQRLEQLKQAEEAECLEYQSSVTESFPPNLTQPPPPLLVPAWNKDELSMRVFQGKILVEMKGFKQKAIYREYEGLLGDPDPEVRPSRVTSPTNESFDT